MTHPFFVYNLTFQTLNNPKGNEAVKVRFIFSLSLQLEDSKKSR